MKVRDGAVVGKWRNRCCGLTRYHRQHRLLQQAY